jgi:arylsulfatase A-like enzyme
VDSYYLETISVPLMIYIPAGLKSKLNTAIFKSNLVATTSNIDIAPTIIDLLQLQNNSQVKELKKNYTGYSLFQKIPKDREIITMNNNEIARFKVGISILKHNLHYIHRTNIVPNREELYDIRKDKKENNNILAKISYSKLVNLKKEFDKYPACNKYVPQLKRKRNPMT